MARYEELTEFIDENVNENGKKKINGAKMNATMKAMVGTLGEGFRIAGPISQESPAPENPENGMCYIAHTGTYVNFDNIVIEDGVVGFIYYNPSKGGPGVAGWDSFGWYIEEFGFVDLSSTNPKGLDEDEFGECLKKNAIIIDSSKVYYKDGIYAYDDGGGSFESVIRFKCISAIDDSNEQEYGYITLTMEYFDVSQSLNKDGRHSKKKFTVSKAVYTKDYIDFELASKQDTLTFDETPTILSDNPVKSKGILEAIESSRFGLVSVSSIPQSFTQNQLLELKKQISFINLTGKITQNIFIKKEVEALLLDAVFIAIPYIETDLKGDTYLIEQQISVNLSNGETSFTTNSTRINVFEHYRMAQLPQGASEGRMVYCDDLQTFVYSDGNKWLRMIGEPI